MPGVAPWGIDGQVCSYFVYYFLGNIIAEHNWIEKMKKRNAVKKFLMAFLLISLNYFLSECKELVVMPYITAIIGVAGWLYMSLLIENNNTKLRFDKTIKCQIVNADKAQSGMILERLGQASLCILCLHVPICEVITNIMVRMTDMTYETGKSELGYVFIRCVLTLLFCMMGQSVIIRMAPWMLGKKRVKEWKEN